ncbi:MAG: Ig-like domain-containing protein, partial [candidate division Zixibacteria bacterium]
SLITISSGPPFHVEVSPTPVGETTNPDNPERFVQVGAGVWDIYANPVEYGTAVHFTLIPNDIAEVEGNSYTGGARPYHPDSVFGWAFSRIIYGCYGTFDTLQVVASSGGENGPVADTSAPFALPAYNPSIFLSANPGNLRCAGPNSYQCDQADVTALLTDGGGCAIEHGQINFSALVAGAIIGPTQVITDENGIAETEYEICGDEIPTPPDGIPRIETAVRAILFGYPDVEAEVDLVCTRPQ